MLQDTLSSMLYKCNVVILIRGQIAVEFADYSRLTGVVALRHEALPLLLRDIGEITDVDIHSKALQCRLSRRKEGFLHLQLLEKAMVHRKVSFYDNAPRRWSLHNF